MLPDSVRSRFLMLLSLGFITGCVSAPTPARVPETPTPREPDRPVTVTTPRGASLFSYRDGSYGYDVVQTTTISVATVSETRAEDTLRTVGSLTYSISSSSGSPVVTVTVDSLVITSARDSAAPSRRLAASVVLQLPLIEPSIATASDSATLMSACDALEETARALASDVHIRRIPVAVERGQSWSDSTSVVICRGGIPLTGTRLSRYQIADVREGRDSVVAKVSRQTTLTISGTGTQGGRRISVRGQGTSDTMFSFDMTGGRFLESTGQSVLRLSFETIQQTDQVVQRSSSSVRLRAATPVR